MGIGGNQPIGRSKPVNVTMPSELPSGLRARLRASARNLPRLGDS